MLRKITAVILGAVIAAGSCVCVSAAESVTQTVEYTASAVNNEWNGKTALKSGRSYSVSGDVTVSKKITIPDGATLTVKKGGKLTLAKGATLNIKGRMTVANGASVSVNGKLYLYKGKKLNISGSVKLGKTSTVTLKGETTIYVGGKIYGSPKKVTVSDSAVLTVKGTNSCAKLAKAVEKRDIGQLYENYLTKIMVDHDSMTAFLESYPSDYISEVEDFLDKQNLTFGYFCEILNAECQEMYSNAKSVEIEVLKLTDITDNQLDEIKQLLKSGYGDCTKVMQAKMKVTLTNGDGSVDEDEFTATAACSGGKWYMVN